MLLYEKSYSVGELSEKIDEYEDSTNDDAVNYRKMNEILQNHDDGGELVDIIKNGEIASDRDVFELTNKGREYVEKELFPKKQERKKWIIQTVIAIASLVAAVIAIIINVPISFR